MEIFEPAFVGSVALIPGAIALGIALGPRARAARASRMTPKVVGAFVLSSFVWFLWVAIWGIGHTKGIRSALLNENSARAEVIDLALSLDLDLIIGVAWLVGLSLAVGWTASLVHAATLLGLAIKDYELPCPGIPWKLKDPRTWRDPLRHACARFCYACAQGIRVEHFLRPVGAGYAMVAWHMLPHVYGRSGAVLCVDILQGDHYDEALKKHGDLYTGELDHIVCDETGGVATIVLRNAMKWTAGAAAIQLNTPPTSKVAATDSPQEQGVPGVTHAMDGCQAKSEGVASTNDADNTSKQAATNVDGKKKRNKKASTPKGWKRIANNRGVVFRGDLIRNVSLRPFPKGTSISSSTIKSALKAAIDKIQIAMNGAS